MFSARELAIVVEVVMIVMGLWFAIFARKAVMEILAAGAWPVRAR